jgi:hypothetical protein
LQLLLKSIKPSRRFLYSMGLFDSEPGAKYDDSSALIEENANTEPIISKKPPIFLFMTSSLICLTCKALVDFLTWQRTKHKGPQKEKFPLKAFCRHFQDNLSHWSLPH